MLLFGVIGRTQEYFGGLPLMAEITHHQLIVATAIASEPSLFFAGLLHDVLKPLLNFVKDEKGCWNWRHLWKVNTGSKLIDIDNVLSASKLPSYVDVDQVINIIKHHHDKNERYLEILVSTKYPYLLKVLIRGSEATLLEISKSDSISRQENLWLRKRDDITKLEILNGEHLKLIRMTASIDSRRGGYRAIDVSLKISIEYLSTKMAFLASVRNTEILEEELKVLKRTGVGKKRDMGFGDLLGWKIYQVTASSNNNLRIIGPIAIAYEEVSETRIITLRNTPSSFIASLKEKGGLLPLNIRMALSRTKPPYWVREELCITPFSELLFKESWYC